MRERRHVRQIHVFLIFRVIKANKLCLLRWLLALQSIGIFRDYKHFHNSYILYFSTLKSVLGKPEVTLTASMGRSMRLKKTTQQNHYNHIFGWERVVSHAKFSDENDYDD